MVVHLIDMIENNNGLNDKTTDKISVTIETLHGKQDESFPNTCTIQKVIDSVVSRCGFSTNGMYDIRTDADPDNPLEPTSILCNCVEDGAVLIFTDLDTGA